MIPKLNTLVEFLSLKFSTMGNCWHKSVAVFSQNGVVIKAIHVGRSRRRRLFTVCCPVCVTYINQHDMVQAFLHDMFVVRWPSSVRLCAKSGWRSSKTIISRRDLYITIFLWPCERKSIRWLVGRLHWTIFTTAVWPRLYATQPARSPVPSALAILTRLAPVAMVTTSLIAGTRVSLIHSPVVSDYTTGFRAGRNAYGSTCVGVRLDFAISRRGKHCLCLLLRISHRYINIRSGAHRGVQMTACRCDTISVGNLWLMFENTNKHTHTLVWFIFPFIDNTSFSTYQPFSRAELSRPKNRYSSFKKNPSNPTEKNPGFIRWIFKEMATLEALRSYVRVIITVLPKGGRVNLCRPVCNGVIFYPLMSVLIVTRWSCRCHWRRRKRTQSYYCRDFRWHGLGAGL